MSDSSFTHLRMDQDADGIVWLWLDVADARANTLSTAVMAELDAALDTLDDATGLVIASAKAGYIAGANIQELSRLDGVDDALALVQRGQALMDRISALSIPTVARIRGHCMGGGLELALACRYRVADNHPATRLSLPEVQLGIHPGFGGTARLPMIVGPLAALDLMLSGRSIDGRAARRMSLVDYCVSPWQLDHAASALVKDDPGHHEAGFWQRLPAAAPFKPLVRAWTQRTLDKKAPRAHYPAPHAILELWSESGGKPMPGRLKAEKRSLGQLIEGSTARNLIRVFLLRDRLKGEARRATEEALPRRVHVIGAGTMGGDIAAWMALNGCVVTLVDPQPKAIAATLRRAHTLFQRRLKHGPAVTAAMDRLIPDAASRGASRADLVIEAIVEDLAAKRALYKELEPVLSSDAVIATNTSSIPLEQLAEGMQHPERLIGLHFFNPVARMPLVEVVAGTHSAEKALGRGQALMAAVDKLPLRVASGPGFLVNRILMPYMLKAARLYAEGKRREDIDAAARRFGMPMGPLELADAVGIDVCVAAADVMAEAFGLEVPERMRQFVNAGRLGRKSGRGFYEYRKGKPRRHRSRAEDQVLDELAAALMQPLLDEAERCREEGVVADADLVDAGAIFGTGFAPFTGGPLQYRKTQAIVHAS